MRAYELTDWGLRNLRLVERPEPTPGPGEVCLAVKAASLNFRDLLVIRGLYNPRFKLPATPLSDGAGVITAVGDDVSEWQVGDHVVSHFVSAWQSGRFESRYVERTLGLPAPGLAAEKVVLPADALVPLPPGFDFAQAATLPIAALTAWSALVTVGNVRPGQSVLTLGTGGVSIFAVQIAKSRGARVIITSSSDDKLARARRLGADETINYRTHPDWEKQVLKLTERRGVDLTVENGGAATLNQSVRATAADGTVALLGALTGLRGEVDLAQILMKRVRVAGIMVDSRDAFVEMNRFLAQHHVAPVIDRHFAFNDLDAALAHMEAGAHFGKIVVDIAPS